MKIRLLAILILVPWCLFAEGGLPTQPYIYVQGNAQVEKAAELVTISFMLDKRNQDQNAAHREIQQQAGQVLKLLDAAQIPPADVVASNLRVESEYEGGDYRNRGKFVGYRATRPFTVKVKEIGKFPKLIEDLLAAGVTEFSGIAEGLKDDRKVQSQVWEEAIADARERAEKVLKPAGMKIESVFAISPVRFPEIRGNIFGGPSYPLSAAAGGVPEIDAAHYRLAPVTVSESVHVIYLISPVK